MPDYETMSGADEMQEPISPKSGEEFVPVEDDTLVTPPTPEHLLKFIGEEELRYGQVRFLDASTSTLPMNILIDNHVFASAVDFGNITPYMRVSDGFHTITISSGLNPRQLFYRKSIPFVKGEPVTMVIVDDINDIDLVQVSDKGTGNVEQGMGCFRVANMSYEESAYDVMFYSGDTVFANVRFKETTFFKQAQKGKYEFFISRAATGFEREELEIIEPKDPPYDSGISQPLYWFTVDVEPKKKYTAYIIGNTWSLDSLRVLVVENS